MHFLILLNDVIFNKGNIPFVLTELSENMSLDFDKSFQFDHILTSMGVTTKHHIEHHHSN